MHFHTFLQIGNPCKNQHIFGSDVSTGYTWVQRSPSSEYLTCSGGDKPIKNIEDIHFCVINQDRELWNKNKIIKHPDDILCTPILLVLKGIIYYKTSILEKDYFVDRERDVIVAVDDEEFLYDNYFVLERKIFIDRKRNVIVTEDNEALPYDDCFVLIEKRCVEDSTYQVEMVALSKYANIMISQYDDINMIHSQAVPPAEIDLCRQSFYGSYLNPEFVSVKCLNGTVMVPLCLKNLFGSRSPIFHIDGFALNGNGCHEINVGSFELLIKWLVMLMIENKFPSLDIMLINEMDIYQWLHISDYFNIPCFMSYFTKVNKCLL